MPAGYLILFYQFSGLLKQNVSKDCEGITVAPIIPIAINKAASFGIFGTKPPAMSDMCVASPE